MTDLRLSNDFTLPPEAVTETFAILAKRGVGKTGVRGSGVGDRGSGSLADDETMNDAPAPDS